jgi:hypothetical protein
MVQTGNVILAFSQREKLILKVFANRMILLAKQH